MEKPFYKYGIDPISDYKDRKQWLLGDSSDSQV